MTLNFQKLSRHQSFPSKAYNLVCIKENNWDDYGFKTIFTVVIYDDKGEKVEIGNTKIGYLKQPEGWTSSNIPEKFESLTENFFSLGQDPDYYSKLVKKLSPHISENFLRSIRDIVKSTESLKLAEEDAMTLKNEGQSSVYYSSLLRDLNISNIKNQFDRILKGGAPLTEYSFLYKRPQSEKHSDISLEFEVNPDIKPSTNIHVLIGRNGVGKTTVLNNMIDAILSQNKDISNTGEFYAPNYFSKDIALDKNYFSGIISVSFSAFDPFIPPPTQLDPTKGPCYHYIGLKRINRESDDKQTTLKSSTELCNDLVDSLKRCFSLTGKKERWINAVNKLESDNNFSEMDLNTLVSISETDDTENKDILGKEALLLFNKLSSGHAIVLLTLTKLVEFVEEKTLVLIDEPESHLHPPLLSAFTRALSDLLLNRNGVAILATHSPVVLQEVPKSCVSILRRTRLSGVVERPNTETFGENVGVLTREIFGLEVTKSGYYDLLAKDVQDGKDYDTIINEYKNQLGFEGRAILRALITNNKKEEDL
ncbi:AAA family ATPase [Pectobacterium brasiliense]|uniref:AAA family ATPase n=1 Tax=Pectobacterium brasiliense TaxID=180957 RepID=UPI00406CAF2B